MYSEFCWKWWQNSSYMECWWCWEYGMLCDVGMLDVGDVGCWGCGIPRMWDVGNVGCWGFGMLRMWNVGDVGCWGCGMLGMWDVGDVGCLGWGLFTGMWDADLQNADASWLVSLGPIREDDNGTKWWLLCVTGTVSPPSYHFSISKFSTLIMLSLELPKKLKRHYFILI